MPEPVNLADPSKNPRQVQRDLKEWVEANPAEVLETMQRRGELKSLRPEAYDRAYKPRFVIHDREPDQNSGHGFQVGDRVVLSDKAMLSASLTGMPSEGRVTGIRGAFIRVGRELYAPEMWEKCGA